MRNLKAEFAPRMPMSEASREVYERLWNDHLTRLSQAVDDESAVLARLSPQAGSRDNFIGDQAQESIDDLVRHASRSVELARELVSGSDLNPRQGGDILSELGFESKALHNALNAPPLLSRK